MNYRPAIGKTENEMLRRQYRLAVLLLGGVAIAAAMFANAYAQAKPPAYLVVEFEVVDPVGWKQYTDAARALGGPGRFLVRAAKGVPHAGDPPKSITIIMFPSMEAAEAFDSSPGYTALKANRDKSAKWRSYVVEGLPS